MFSNSKYRNNSKNNRRSRTELQSRESTSNGSNNVFTKSVGEYPNNNNFTTTNKNNYSAANNRELKIPNIIKEYKEEIELARESRLCNKLQDDVDNRKEITNKGYRVKSMIGSGSYAHVFRARDVNKRRDVALKLIELDKCSKHYKDYFLRTEIHVIRHLSHENIVLFYEAFNIPQAYVMVMEFIDNGTFADLLYTNGPFSERLAKSLFRGTSMGMYYMHSHSIAHRDLKLENLLLTNDLKPKISDFSLSLIWDRKKLCTNWCGTPPYFAPEILQKKPYNPLMYDMWSLGVCLYVMLNDTIPFHSTDDQQMLQKQLKREWKLRAKIEPYLSANLKSLMRQLLEPDCCLRFTIQDVIHCKWFDSE